ncbi:hypothetical protein, conserved [Entamoeba dispar SAW760]|uniref:Peptidase S54 rhomboid domain-containing protein n=1 Tax=Entamoeba dispar (strain ATCC PRA-260 / SAW760) TaxID=370354 RepID=B0E728_ENTDS|nr:uncharacterized protein EDI_300760 [Entamoeba dispar SAW760]EDR29670.1 hypothetical protein, conserved [Entamoeba dispar SAW760]|eukprot:EDR29670.1 hypothetical protein, conserved [Entamoeba dispar SAW760]
MFLVSFNEITKYCQECIKNISFLSTVQLIIIWGVYFILPELEIEPKGFSPLKSRGDFIHQVGPMLYHCFIHEGILHLFGNSISLFVFGALVEKQIGTTRIIILFILSIILQPILMISLFSLKLASGNSVVGMSGYIFTLIIIFYYQPGKYMDVIYCCILNIISYIFCLLLLAQVSLSGHFCGIIIGVLYTRGFLDWLFNSRLITIIDTVIKRFIGCLIIYIPIPENSINTQSHLQIMSLIKSDIKSLISHCSRHSNDANTLNSLPI